MVDKERRNFCKDLGKIILASAVVLATPTVLSGCVPTMDGINDVYEAGAKPIRGRHKLVYEEIGNRNYITRILNLKPEYQGEYLPFLITMKSVYKRDPKTWDIEYVRDAYGNLPHKIDTITGREILDKKGNPIDVKIPIEIPCIEQMRDNRKTPEVVVTRAWIPKLMHGVDEVRVINKFCNEDSSRTKDKTTFENYSEPLNMISHDRRKIGKDLDLFCLNGAVADERDPEQLPIVITFYKLNNRLPRTRVANHFIYVHENGGFYRPVLIGHQDNLKELVVDPKNDLEGISLFPLIAPSAPSAGLSPLKFD